MESKERIKLGIGMILLQSFLCVIRIYIATDIDVIVRKKLFVVNAFIALCMWVCIVIVSMSSDERRKVNIQNSVLCLLMAISLGINEGTILKNYVGCILFGIFGVGLGVVIAVWPIRGKRAQNKKVNSLFIGGSTLGLIAGKYIVSRVGQENAVNILSILMLILETLMVMLGIVGLMKTDNNRCRS